MKNVNNRHIDNIFQIAYCRHFDRDYDLPGEEQDEETIANLLKSLREAADAWLKENPSGLDLLTK